MEERNPQALNLHRLYEADGSMADNFFNNPSPQPQNGSFMQQAQPAQGNPWMTQQPQQQPGYPQYATNPQMGAASAAMIYQQMGYWDGNPTEIDIISDIIKASAPVSRFLAAEQGLPALATFLSVLLDYKLVNFFKDFKIGVVQGEDGQMFLQPVAEQPTDKGKELSTMTMAEVQTSMTSISETLKSTLIANADQQLANHRQAAGLKAQQMGVEGVISDALDGGKSGKPGILATTLNLVGRSAGLPLPPVNQGTMPPPPPGR